MARRPTDARSQVGADLTAASIEQLLGRFAAGRDPEVLAEVFARTAPRLVRQARRFLDRAGAEDAVQELFLSLLRSGTKYDGERRALPFLRGALYRQAMHLTRVPAGTVADIELPASDHDPIAAASHAEAVRMVRAAISQLPAEQGIVVLLFLEQGLTPSEIGRRLHRPATTVRVQLHRGLARVRQELPPTLGLATLLGLLGGRLSAAQPSCPLPRRSWPLSAAAAVIAGAAALLWALAATEPYRPASPVVANTGVAPEASGNEAAELPGSDLSSERVAVPTAPPRLAVLVHDPAGRGIPHVGVRAHPVGVDPDFGAVMAVTDAAGRATLSGLATGQVRIEVDRGPSRECVLEGGNAATIEFAVRGGCDVVGQVVDESGTPVGGASIAVCCNIAQACEGQPVARSDDEGRFALQALPRHAAVWAVVPARAPSVLHWVGDRATQHMTLCLGGPAATVRGRVHGPDGPVAGALVLVGRRPRSGYTRVMQAKVDVTPDCVVRTDASGAFVVSGLPAGQLEVLARAPGIATAIATVTARAGFDVSIEIRARAGERWAGRVCDRAGRPIGTARVVAQALSTRRASATVSAADGSFVLHGVDGRRREVTAIAPGHRPVWQLVSGDVLDLRLELEAIPGRRGRLLGRDDRAVDPVAWELAVSDGRATPRPVPLGDEAVFDAVLPHAREVRFLARRRGTTVWVECEESAADADLRVAASADMLANVRLRLHGFTDEQRADALVFVESGAGSVQFEQVGRRGECLDIPNVPAQRWQFWLRSRRGLIPPLSLGDIDVPAAGCEVPVPVPEWGWLDYRYRCDDGSGIGTVRAMLVNHARERVLLTQAAGRVALPAGRWRLWGSSLRAEAVLGEPFQIRAGRETRVDAVARRGHCVQIGFWLRDGIDVGSATLSVRRGNDLIARSAPGLRDGFAIGIDGYCSGTATLADGDYRLEIAGVSSLSGGVGDLSGAFRVQGEEPEGEPIVVELEQRWRR